MDIIKIKNIVQKMMNGKLDIHSTEEYFFVVNELQDVLNFLEVRPLVKELLIEIGSLEFLEQQISYLKNNVKIRIQPAVNPNTFEKDFRFMDSLVEFITKNSDGSIMCKPILEESTLQILPSYFDDNNWISLSEVLDSNFKNPMRYMIYNIIIRTHPTENGNPYAIGDPVTLLYTGEHHLIVKEQNGNIKILTSEFIDDGWVTVN